MVRVKQRYFLVEIIPSVSQRPLLGELHSSVNERSILRSVRESVEEIHGDFGVGATQAGFTIKMFNSKTSVFVLRVRRGPHVLVASALSFVRKIGIMSLTLKTLHLSGTIRSCLKFLQQYDRQQLIHVLRHHQLSQDQKEKIHESMLKSEQKISGETELREEY
ncbi:ribonuclease P/MRP protein subunit POP5-like [Limulus polyphemus]|uniref:Ribonuclease P/MRP protein subunit POP5 n=1 Tax=Limulus polyphemus TaxID=6850 RepID=A0ABM1BLK1_LIMPO|nr:ribonuclease P/MRP protein subunit POP5-like [Limulus polyphemus]